MLDYQKQAQDLKNRLLSLVENDQLQEATALLQKFASTTYKLTRELMKQSNKKFMEEFGEMFKKQLIGAKSGYKSILNEYRGRSKAQMPQDCVYDLDQEGEFEAVHLLPIYPDKAYLYGYYTFQRMRRNAIMFIVFTEEITNMGAEDISYTEWDYIKIYVEEGDMESFVH